MKMVITAGPTREPIDPVRFISNRSSGKMGYAIAEAAVERGHSVTLISGPVCLQPPPAATYVPVVTSDEMFAAVCERVKDAGFLVMSAAVADFKPARYVARKIKKQEGISHLELVPAVDILASLAAMPARPPSLMVAGFAAETDLLAENAVKKLREKQLDLIVANDVSRSDAGFESDYNELSVYFRSGDVTRLTRDRKSSLARALVRIFEDLKEKS